MNARMQEELDPQPTATGKGWMFDPAKLINMILEIYGITPDNLPDGVTCCHVAFSWTQFDRDRKVLQRTSHVIIMPSTDREVLHQLVETERSIINLHEETERSLLRLRGP